jgi:hypothetical protein
MAADLPDISEIVPGYSSAGSFMRIADRVTVTIRRVAQR